MAAAYKTSLSWVKRMEQFFTQSDFNKDGYLSIEDFDMWSDNLEKEAKADPKILKKARQANRELWESTGLKPGVLLTKEQFIENMAEVAVVQRAGFDEGKESIFYNMIDSVFDAVDTNRDGYLQLSEYELMMKVSNFDADTAKILFNVIDTNHDGKLSRNELRESNVKFWFTPNDSLVAGLYGKKFETT